MATKLQIKTAELYLSRLTAERNSIAYPKRREPFCHLSDEELWDHARDVDAFLSGQEWREEGYPFLLETGKRIILAFSQIDAFWQNVIYLGRPIHWFSEVHEPISPENVSSPEMVLPLATPSKIESFAVVSRVYQGGFVPVGELVKLIRYELTYLRDTIL